MAFLVKRPELEFSDFVDYYENRHVPLILGLGPGPVSYKRNFIAPSRAAGVARDLGPNPELEAWARGARREEPGARSQARGARREEPGARSQARGARREEPGARSQARGARREEPRIALHRPYREMVLFL